MADLTTYDEIVTFGRVLAHAWRYDENLVDDLFGYMDAPHKWEREYREWRRLGGTTDKACLDAFSDWYEHRNDVEDDSDDQ